MMVSVQHRSPGAPTHVQTSRNVTLRAPSTGHRTPSTEHRTAKTQQLSISPSSSHQIPSVRTYVLYIRSTHPQVCIQSTAPSTQHLAAASPNGPDPPARPSARSTLPSSTSPPSSHPPSLPHLIPSSFGDAPQCQCHRQRHAQIGEDGRNPLATPSTSARPPAHTSTRPPEGWSVARLPSESLAPPQSPISHPRPIARTIERSLSSGSQESMAESGIWCRL